MNLRTTLEKILNLLSKQPNAEHQAKLKASVTKLMKAATDFQDQLELSSVENSVEYATLAGLLSDPSKKKIATLAWVNSHFKRLGLDEITGKTLTASAKSQFLIRVATSDAIKEIIKELSQTEENKLQDEFARMAGLSDSRVRDELDQRFKAAKLEPFCRANSVAVAKKTTKGGKASVDRKATYSHILSALADFRERQKL